MPADDNGYETVTIAAMAVRIGPKKPVRVYLAAWREELGLTQQELGDRIGKGIDKGTVSRWERSKRIPSADVLAAYAEALGRNVVDLYSSPNSPESPPWSIWDKLKPAQRKQAIRLLKALVEDEAA